MSNTNSNGQHKTAGRMRDLIEGFDALALRLQGKTRPSEPPAQPLYPASGNNIYTDAAGNRSQYPYPTHANGGFVGGFRPKPTMPPATPLRTHAYSGPPGYEPLPPLPRPPTMPKPHHSPMSLTMQHALHGMPAHDPNHSNLAPPPILPQRPHSDPEVPSKSDEKGKRKTDGPHTPQPIKIAAPVNRRTNSAPSSPTGSASGSGVGDRPVQCAGITNAGQRCKKMVRVNSAKAATETDTFCHQHEKKMREPSGFYDRKTGKTFIKFDDYIPPYLQRSTQASLRSEMQKALSEKDEDGYIYAFEILDDSDKNVVHLKVGRAVNLNARMDQWQRQCSSKENVLRGYWPDGMEANQPTMRGLIEAGRKGPWCHRVERLVHLELADLATYTPYMDNKFPKCEPPIADGDAATRKQAKADVKRCPDCGKTHKEIFTFERVKRGPYQGKEWTSIVSSVIKKWGEFVEAYL